MEPLFGTHLKAILNKWIDHVYRETNQCADALARLGLGIISSFVIFLEPLHVVEKLVAFDKAGMLCNRLINS